MTSFVHFTASASRHALRWALRGIVLVVAVCLAIALGFTLYAVSALPPLQPWHTERLTGEYTALRHGNLDYDGYLQLEDRLFDELSRTVAQWERTDEIFVHSRFNPQGTLRLLADGAPYNRSYRLTPTPSPSRGTALLLHGLTDSPYSMKALAESLLARGFEVTVLRLPGHGTLPSMMLEMSYRDWLAAMKLAARDVAARAASGQPFYIGGYSTGGTLALLYALESLDDSGLRRPDRVLLLSPAIELTPVAVLANIIDVASVVPVPVLEKVRWQEIVSEFDPYKFNSFPVNASRQVNRATRALRRELERAERDGRLARMPPVTAWQSVVDSTVGATGTVDTLFARLRDPKHRLVLFDVNRSPALRSVQRPAARELIERTERSRPAYTLEVVTNAQTDSEALMIHRRAPDGAVIDRMTSAVWPADLVSLGHVALPFPPDDPVYGFRRGSGRAGIPSIGSWLLRGESGAITVSLGSLTRLRSNPFWSLIDEQIGAIADADLAVAR
jgi:alpha-beta hydrolase superfamily lysophospholipase